MYIYIYIILTFSNVYRLIFFYYFLNKLEKFYEKLFQKYLLQLSLLIFKPEKKIKKMYIKIYIKINNIKIFTIY
jgi:hypothetical protein